MTALNRVSWAELLPAQKVNRITALEVLRKMRNGYSLTASAREVGMSVYSSRKFLGRNVLKKGGRWRPTKTDSIQRSMRIYEDGEIRTITITNSRDAEFIGKYYIAVRKYLETGDVSYLKPFKRRKIYDINGVGHKLETDPNKIREIEERKEDSEFFEIYSDE